MFYSFVLILFCIFICCFLYLLKCSNHIYFFKFRIYIKRFLKIKEVERKNDISKCFHYTDEQKYKILSSDKMYDYEMTSNQRKTVFIVGKTGVGKSSLGNFFLGSNDFFVNDTSFSVTTKCDCFYSNRFGFHVLDTMGFADFAYEREMKKDDEIVKDIVEFVMLNNLSVGAILLVLDPNLNPRSDSNVLMLLKAMIDNFGHESLNKCILTFSRVENDNSVIKYLDAFNKRLIDNPELSGYYFNLCFGATIDNYGSLRNYDCLINLINEKFSYPPCFLDLQFTPCLSCGILVDPKFTNIKCYRHELDKNHSSDFSLYHQGISEYVHTEILDQSSIGTQTSVLIAFALAPLSFGASAVSVATGLIYDNFFNKPICKKCKKLWTSIGCHRVCNKCKVSFEDEGCSKMCNNCKKDINTPGCLSKCKKCDGNIITIGCSIHDEHNYERNLIKRRRNEKTWFQKGIDYFNSLKL